MSAPRKPPLSVELEWAGDLRFDAHTPDAGFVVDSAGKAGPSPMQTLGVALAGCMGMDVVHTLVKGRHPLKGLHVSLAARRADTEPRRFLSIDLRVIVKGDVPAPAVERALALSREKYCSVWHSLREDISLNVTFDLQP